ncbi:MAG: NAD-dependent epimerase/dehydratase family protein [Candidatus Latescibacteria bacterium]|nr:NAD-dependent epimerase/dehydratase family protein [Candidatus Latescibacterota bacterium]NIM21096.1 NAD-dependent epimerase/dehydratase family protein [Candidatus Latescibacterota bacterium]NIM65231.1 NAD-dependent epimerase/dehydratase family protein [Candidatus Latescibacterota bacterium]NIO01746.1 NAD-dependent epimerase/dehydratase family protein [Candidatus Latescibacterota bacterium]NIO28263.1 NAD-dependent epimerase/dehydratase family protein [Candidatus Latescibacterota bacterium]
MPGKILVTGAAGFIGSHLCERLVKEGYDVVGVDSLTDYYDVRIKRENLRELKGNEKFTYYEHSLNDMDLGSLIGEVDVIFHQAAQAGVRASWGNRFEEYIDSNIRATQRLCEAAKNHPIRRFVFASSSSVYGETTNLPMGETQLPKPVSPYGVTKLASENLCLLYKKNYNLPAVCLRYFTVYGPRQRPDMAFHKFILRAMKGKPVEIYGNGTQTRDFTYIDDVIEANMSAMAYNGSESVFNIGGGSRVSLNSALDILHDCCNLELDVRYKDAFKGDVKHTYADIALAQRELNYKPKVKLDQGLAYEVEWVGRLIRKLGDS